MNKLVKHLKDNGLCGEIDIEYLTKNTSWQQMKKNFKLLKPIITSNFNKNYKKYTNISFRDTVILSRLNKKIKNIYKLYCDNLEHDIVKVINNGLYINKFDIKSLKNEKYLNMSVKEFISYIDSKECHLHDILLIFTQLIGKDEQYFYNELAFINDFRNHSVHNNCILNGIHQSNNKKLENFFVFENEYIVKPLNRTQNQKKYISIQITQAKNLISDFNNSITRMNISNKQRAEIKNQIKILLDFIKIWQYYLTTI